VLALDQPTRSFVTMQLLTRLGPAAQPAIPRLMQTVKTGDSLAGNAAAAVLSIADAGSDAGKQALAVLIRMLEEEQLPKFGAQVAASLMSVLGAKAAGAVPNLVAALDSEDPILVEICCRALGEIGPAAKTALPRLEELQQSQNPNVKAAATRAVELLK
jgi:HEAT repeat protein